MMNEKKVYRLKKFRKKDIPKLNYGVIHSQVGFTDGVSIVMKQIESVMVNKMGVPKCNIYYLVGKSKQNSPYIRKKKILWHKNKVNLLAEKFFEKGFGGALSEKIEYAIWEAKSEIKKFIYDKKIDVLIVHNSSHPVNFISSVALSRYYRDEINAGKKTPKYILWWHDSHLERNRYSNPSRDIKNYLLEGVPGKHVEYIVFINGLQFENAQKYLMELDSRSPGFYENALKNHTVTYNTATTYINAVEDLDKEEFTERTERFLEEFKINELLKKKRLKLVDVQFCLQHTRIVPRKRIDFALEYSYELFKRLKEKKMRKSMIFFISGHSGDERGNYRRKLVYLNKKLSKKYKTDKFFLIFAEDFPKATISFEQMPLILAKLGGISTYFSEIEGFGNNLLEVLAAGLIPAVYTYPVFKSDLSRYKFKTVTLDKFETTPRSVSDMCRVIEKDRVKKSWANKNIEILKKKFSDEIIVPKLTRAIIRNRKQYISERKIRIS
jgi:mannosylglucosylglycerate synthase